MAQVIITITDKPGGNGELRVHMLCDPPAPPDSSDMTKAQDVGYQILEALINASELIDIVEGDKSIFTNEGDKN